MHALAPDTLEAALDALAKGGVEIVAGGTDWFPARGLRPLEGRLLDITRVRGLRGIARQDGGWRIGAATTWTDLIRADLPPAFDALKAAAREVGAVQIQNAGTLAGNLCNASPAADGVPPLLTLGAEVDLASCAGTRRLPLGAFLTGVRRTARRADELVTAIFVPDPGPEARSGFFKVGAREYLVISIVMAAVTVRLDAGRLRDARVAVGAASPVALRLDALEAALEGLTPAEALRALAPEHVAALAPLDDIRADAAYRREAALEAVRRALASALETPAHG